MDDDFELEMSPLCQAVSNEGKTVRVKIFGDGDGRWILEIEDEFRNSTVWDDTFETDQDALDEAIKAINDEGINQFIGPEDGKSDGQWG